MNEGRLLDLALRGLDAERADILARQSAISAPWVLEATGLSGSITPKTKAKRTLTPEHLAKLIAGRKKARRKAKKGAGK